MRHVKVNGVEVAHEVVGRSQPILFIHGAHIADAAIPDAKNDAPKTASLTCGATNETCCAPFEVRDVGPDGCVIDANCDKATSRCLPCGDPGLSCCGLTPDPQTGVCFGDSFCGDTFTCL